MTPGGGRRIPLRVTAALLAAFWGLLFYGLIDLLAFLQGPEFHATILLSTGWGLVFLFLVAAPLVVIAVASPRTASAAAAEVTAVAAAVTIAAVLSGSPQHLSITVGLLLTVAVVAWLGHALPRAVGWQWSIAPTVALAVAVVPAASYAWTAGRSTGSGRTTDDTWGLDHWPIQAALPVALLLVAAVAAGHPRGWRVPLWTTTAATVEFGVIALAEPSLVGSLSSGWAVAVIAWAVVFAVLTLRSAPSEA